MNIHDLREAQARYENDLASIKKVRKQLYNLRASFVNYFNEKFLSEMTINDYSIGVDLPHNGYNFCYGLERQLDGLGRIIGATAFKFGVYFGRTKSDDDYKFRFTSKFGATYKEAFKNVQLSILHLIRHGKIGDLDQISSNKLSPMFKGKILSTYFPEKYLNVFSDDHLNYFLVQLGLDSDDLFKSDPVFKRQALVDFKNDDVVMKHWSVDLFSNFLYNGYPGRPPIEQAIKPSVLADYVDPIFPPNPKAIFVDLNILSSIPKTATSTKKIKGKKDYEVEAKRNKKLGDRGEKIVMDIEFLRLKNLGKENLAKKIKRVSLESDSYGYDIISYEPNGEKRYIEVKATTSKVGEANFFYTANELQTAESIKNYFIYMVYEVTSKTPKVWAIANPFNPVNERVVKVPATYKVIIKAEKNYENTEI